MRRFFLCGAALALAGCAHLPPPGVHMRALNLPVTSFVSPSGMRVLIEQDPGAHAVGVVAVVGAGSAADPAGKEGLAHLVEHLSFRSRPDGKNQLQNLLEVAGAGDVNAATGLDTTTYYAFGAPESLQSLLNLVGVQVAAPLLNIDPATFDTERAVIGNELRERQDHGDFDQVVGWMQHALYPDGSPYAHGAGGEEAALSKLTLDDAKAFVSAHYVPQNITLVIAGDVTAQQVAQMMDRVLPQKLHDFAPHSEETPKLVAQEPPAPPAHAMYRYEGAVEGPTLYLAWSLPPAFGENDGLETLLEHQFDSHLGMAFYKDDDIASVSANLVRGKQAAMLFCEVKLLKGEHPEQTANYVLDQAFQTWAVDASIARKRSTIITALLAQQENMEARAVSRGEIMQLTGDPAAIDHTYGQIAHASSAKVQAFAYKYLSRDRARMILVTPAKGAPVVAATAPSDAATADAVQVKYDPAIIARIAQAPGLAAFHGFTLPNGLRVAIGQRPAWPQVTAVLSFEGGEDDGAVPGAGLLAQLADQNEDSYSNGYPFEYGALIGNGSDAESTAVYAVGGGGNIENLLAMLEERVSHMTFKGYQLDEAGPRYIKLLQHGFEQPRSTAHRALMNALYGESTLGHAVTAAELGKVGTSDVTDWLDRTYDPRRAALVIVGDVDPVATETMVRNWMGDWSGEQKQSWEAPLKELPTAPRPRVLVTPAESSQTELTLACAMPTASAREASGLKILAEVLAQNLDGAVRQSIGATYGFQPSVRTLRGGISELSIHGAVDPARLQTVLRELHHRWALLPLALHDTELGRARWALARGYAVRFLTDLDLAGTAADALRRGEELKSVDGFAEELNGFTRPELQKLAASCAKDSALSVVGDPAGADAALTGIWK